MSDEKQTPPPECEELESDEEGDPGVVIIYSDAQEVHQVLGLPAVRQIQLSGREVAPLQQGKY